jgi:hypothetical protein
MCACRYAPTYDELDGGLAARAVGFDELRAQLVGQVGTCSAYVGH